jgi:hypothetical protein
VGFFDRLGNLGKGWVSGLGKKVDNSVLENELREDRLRPTPGAEAAAELAALKAGKGKEAPSNGSSSPPTESESPDTPEEPSTSAPGPVKKTL